MSTLLSVSAKLTSTLVMACTASLLIGCAPAEVGTDERSDKADEMAGSDEMGADGGVFGDQWSYSIEAPVAGSVIVLDELLAEQAVNRIDITMPWGQVDGPSYETPRDNRFDNYFMLIADDGQPVAYDVYQLDASVAGQPLAGTVLANDKKYIGGFGLGPTETQEQAAQYQIEFDANSPVTLCLAAFASPGATDGAQILAAFKDTPCYSPNQDYNELR